MGGLAGVALRAGDDDGRGQPLRQAWLLRLLAGDVRDIALIALADVAAPTTRSCRLLLQLIELLGQRLLGDDALLGVADGFGQIFERRACF